MSIKLLSLVSALSNVSSIEFEETYSDFEVGDSGSYSQNLEYGVVTRACTIKIEGQSVEFIYWDWAQCPVGKHSRMVLSRDVEEPGDNDEPSYEGPSVVDEKGDFLSPQEVVEAIKEEAERFFKSLKSFELEFEDEQEDESVESFDSTEKTLMVFGDREHGDFGPYRAQRTGKVDLVFTGKLLGCASTKTNSCFGWEDYEVYLLPSGKYIATQRDLSLWEGDETECHATICVDEKAVIEVLGNGPRLREMYLEIGFAE